LEWEFSAGVPDPFCENGGQSYADAPNKSENGLRYLSVCSGIEAATVAWHSLGWEAAAFSEIEAFPRAVLQHHYPETPLHGDFTTIRGDEYGPIDLLVGGTPCQSFSVAGLRRGLADQRGNLALEYLKLAARTRAEWLVWENVPGVLSSNGGRDFGSFLGGLAELGYGLAYRVLDAQYFGVPQRRRRVFLVANLGDWCRPAAVLFERHSLSGNPAPRREKGQNAPTIPSRSSAGGGLGTDFDCDGGLIPQGCGGETAPTLNAAYGSKLGLDNQHIDSGAGLFVAHSLRAEGFDASEDGTGRGTPLVPVAVRTAQTGSNGWGVNEESAYTLDGANGQCIAFTAKDHGADASDISPTLRSGSHSGSHANGGVMPAVAFAQNQLGEVRSGDVFNTLNTNANASGRNTAMAAIGSAVRRLTPRECERLQGFPDDYSLVPYRGKMAADGPRYKALGNSMAVPVMRWIGGRIAKVEAICAQRLAA
jgi:DNA (cytosine-5)-methyltransferase 1